MKTTRLLKSIATVTMLVGASLSANANIVQDKGVVSGAKPTVFNGFGSASAFLDTFVFSLPANMASGYSVITQVSNTTGIVGMVGSANDHLLAFAVSPPGGSGAHHLSFGPSASGSYDLNGAGITGTAHSGGSSVAPVPQTYAMLLAGLGVMGAIARRRKV